MAVFTAPGCALARGCWCMYYRQSGQQPLPTGMRRADANRNAMRALVAAGTNIGLLAYRGDAPIGWLSFGPREDFAKLVRSPVMKPVDDTAVWSVICFVVPGSERGRGVAKQLLASAIDWSRKQGVRVLEAYPVDQPGPRRDDSLWFGTAKMYLDAGFTEVARRKPTRPILRLALGSSRPRSRGSNRAGTAARTAKKTPR